MSPADLDYRHVMRRIVPGLVAMTVAWVPMPARAQSRSYCAVEVGAKGVKGRGFTFGEKKAESLVATFYSKEINTTIIASMKNGELTSAAIDETADAAFAMLKDMKAANPGCKPFAVGSSALAGVNNRQALGEAISQRVDSIEMEFVTPEQEAEFGFIASVPKRDWNSAVIVDIGSGNTKLGYRTESGFKAAEVPLGSVSLTKAASGGGSDFAKALGTALDSTARPALREIASRMPGIMNRRKVFWIGGAAWSTATFMRPDQSARDFVRLDRTDMTRFVAALKDRTWANYKPSIKASAIARAQFEKDSAKVVEVFSRDNLLSGVSLFDAFLEDRGVEGPIYFARNGQWVMGYAAAKYADDVWGSDALDKSLE